MATRKNNSRKSKKSNANLLGTGCVVLGLLIILIAFLVNKDRILTNFKDTGFFDRVFGSTPEFVQNHESQTSKDTETVDLKEVPVTIEIQEEKKQKPETLKVNEEPEIVKKVEKAENKDIKEVKENKIETSKESVAKEVKKEENKPAKPATTDLQLCFVNIDPDGSVVRKIIKRKVEKTDSPLTEALKQLMKGPDLKNAGEKGCISLIPDGTKLLGVKVQNGVAYLNFNEEFTMNQEGVEGSIAQLMQIVYTATSFSTVNSVQFLIEGEKREYLSEGQWIGSPLSRNSF